MYWYPVSDNRAQGHDCFFQSSLDMVMIFFSLVDDFSIFTFMSFFRTTDLPVQLQKLQNGQFSGKKAGKSGKGYTFSLHSAAITGLSLF